ncbi:hypothetical protein BCR39DRAFT_528946 [Naematelia encephala]|uniref:JmjC domain-containing protein n=1 Tax=Naematelia encephala TaxID=71784 RepID=A0A1Y2B6W1_9TREE|nr:hypothetical protein BCR39DRAFT_528946 [Naematelia encephala]
MPSTWRSSPELFALVHQITHQLEQDLSEVPGSNGKDLASCGYTTICLLRESIQTISSIAQSSSVNEKVGLRARVVLQSLFSLADDSVNALPFHAVDRKWLRLYTDSSILQVIFDVVVLSNQVPTAAWAINAVERLDRTIIIAGALGHRRMDWVQALISLVQRLALPRIASTEQRPNKRRRLDVSARQKISYAASEIPTLNEPPSLPEYVEKFSDRPFILRGYISSRDSPMPRWPALDRWTSADYLFDQVGEGRVVPVEVGTSYDDENWGQTILPLRDFLHRAGYQVSSPTKLDGPPLYLAQYPLFNQFPQLERDIVLPDYNGIEINVWIGSGGGEIVSPAHTDPYFNCYAQLLGRKRVWLAPPSCSEHMQAYAGADSSEENDTLAQRYMTNTSTVPVLRSNVSGEDLQKAHPEYAKYVWPHSLEAVLEPGDVLVVPPKWWHAMRGEGEGVGWSVSMWY